MKRRTISLLDSTATSSSSDPVAPGLCRRPVNNTPLQFLAAGYADPHSSTTRWITAHQVPLALLPRAWARHADTLMAAADDTLKLWNDEIDFGRLGRRHRRRGPAALQLSKEIRELDERIAVLLQAGPSRDLVSAPGVGKVMPPNPARLGSQPIQSWPVPGPLAVWCRPSIPRRERQHGTPTKSGDAPLREHSLWLPVRPDESIRPWLSLSPAHGRGGQASQLGLMSREHRPPHSLSHAGEAALPTSSGTSMAPQSLQQKADHLSERFRLRYIRELRRTTKAKGDGPRRKESPGAPSTSRPPSHPVDRRTARAQLRADGPGRLAQPVAGPGVGDLLDEQVGLVGRAAPEDLRRPVLGDDDRVLEGGGRVGQPGITFEESDLSCQDRRATTAWPPGEWSAPETKSGWPPNPE